MHSLVTESAPWWGAPLLAGLFLLLGSGLTMLATWLRGRSDQQHTDRRRWDDLLLDTCVEIDRICDELVTIGKFGYPRYIADDTERVNRHMELTSELNTTIAKFVFVASNDLKNASAELYGASIRHFSGVTPSAESDAFTKARNDFLATARRELRAN